MAALTSDIVWLDTMTVMVNGQPKKVVYPRVYTRANRPMTLQTDGALISASNLVINTKGAVANTGTLLGDTIVMQADRLQQGGYIRAKTLGVTTVGDIVNTGTLDATDRVQLVAGRDVVLNNTVTHLANQDVLTTMAGIAVSGEDGVLLLSANRDVKLAGATLTALGTKSQLAIGAGRNVALTTDTLKAKQDMTQDSNNYLRTYRQTEVGTAIRGHDVTILAKQDLMGRATTIQGTGAVRLGAGTALILTSGESISKDNFGAKYKVSGFLSSTTTTMTRDSEHRQVAGSVVTGRTVTMESGQDMNLTAATIVGTEATALRAGGSVTATSAEQYDHEASMLSVKKSGLMGSGLGFMIGTQKTTDTALGEGLTQVGTVIGSSKGTVVVAAGKDIHLTSSDVVGQEGIRMEGASITLDGKENTSHERYTHEVSSSGLSVSLGGAVVSAATTAVNYLQQAGDRKDARLAALETLEAGKSLREGLSNVKNYTQFTEAGLQSAYQGAANQAMQSMTSANVKALAAQAPGSLWSAQTAANATDQAANATALATKANDTAAIKKEYADQKAAKRDNLLNIHVGIGSSHAQSVTDVKETRYAGGTIESTDGAVQLWARGNDTESGNLTAIGQRIQGKTVELQATGNSNLLAGTNTMHITENSKSSGWSVGANIGTTGFLGADLSLSKATSEGLTDRVTYTGTTVVGTDAVTVTSGKDTTMAGSTVSGQTVTATVGGNLTISSLQDTDIYRSTSKNSGLAISYTPGQPSILSGGQTNGKIHSDYRSVTKQAGIYAGTGGYDITTNGTTTLTGAVIASKADKETNRLTTGNLIMKDIQNEASYSASSDGFNLSTDKGTAVNPLGLGKVTSIPVNGEATSITRSAIAEGLILVADKRSEKEINHNTQEAMQTLGKIFDKKSVEEKQALVNQMAQEGYKLIGDVAVSKQKELLRKALVAAANNDKKSAEAYLQEAKKWEEGGTYKLILHGALGGVLSGMSSEGFSSGFVGATSNELLQKALGKIPDSELHKLASLVIGNTVSGKTGGAIAEIATDENWLNHYDQMALLTDIINYKQEWTPDKTTIMNKLAYYIALSNKTEPYAEQLGINDGIDNSFIGLNSLAVYLPIGKNTLAAGLYGFAEAEGIDRGMLDRAVSYHESYMTDAYLKSHYPLLNATAEETYNAYSRNSDLSFNNMLHKDISTYANKGDYYADKGYSVIASTDGNNYVYVGGQFMYTTREAQYTKEEFGSALADLGWPVKRVYWNGQPVNVVEYNGVAYYANRKATDGTIIGADANKDVSTINRVAIAVDHGGESSSFSGGAEYAGENLSLFRKVRTKLTPDFGHVSLVFFNNTGDSPEELNFGRYGKDPGITHSSDKLWDSLLNPVVAIKVLMGKEEASFLHYQGTYVVDSSSYDPATDYKNTYILNISKDGAQDVARKVNNQIPESGYTYRSTEVWITPKRKGDVAYRLNGDTSSYDLLHNNCATVTINAIKEALGNSDIIVNKDNIAELLSLIRPATVEYILEEDYKNYHGEGIVKEIQRGKR